MIGTEESRTRPEGSEGNEGSRESHTHSNRDKIGENTAIPIPEIQNNDKKDLHEGGRPPIGPSEGSDPSGQVIEKSSTIKHDRYFSLGKYHCKNCNASGDKVYMDNTKCKGC
jgi:hypothetical protein